MGPPWGRACSREPCLSPRKGPAGTGPTQQLQLWELVGTQEGPGLKAPKAILPASSAPRASWRTERPSRVTPSLRQTEPRFSPGSGETRAHACPADPWRCLRAVLGPAGPPMARGQQVCSRASRVQAPQLDSERDVKCAGSTAEPRSSARPPGSLGDSSKDSHWGTGGGCLGYETAVPQPRDSKDLARAVPSDSVSGGPLSCPDVTDGGVPGMSRLSPEPQFPLLILHLEWEGMRLAHRDRLKVLAHLGRPGAWACVTLPATQHITRVPGTDWQLRAPLGGQGRGLGGTAGLVAEGGGQRAPWGARSHRGARNPMSSEGRGFPGACEPFTVPPRTTGQPLCSVLRAGQERRGGNMAEPQLPGRGASCGINRVQEGAPGRGGGSSVRC